MTAMAAPHRLDTPPPASRFRRPWSPEPFDPHPPRSPEHHQHFGNGYGQRRELSDVTVEALDLADYARTLAHQGDSRYASAFQPVFSAYDSYPPSPQPLRPLASRDSFSPPPVLSPSSTTSHYSYSSAAPQHRPFSLPPPAAPPRGVFQNIPSHSSHSSRPAYDDPLLTPPDEVDIGQFPKFARGWYRNPRSGYFDPLRQGSVSPEVDLFDPTYPTEQKSFPSLPACSSPHLSSQASRSSRDVVPWGSDPTETAQVDPDVKAERVRMLEKEFGKDAKGEVDEEHLVGSVDPSGRLITEGPKKRLTTRWMQILLALLAGGSSIYGAAFIKPKTAPPPANKPPAYILYVLSVLTFLFATYFFLIHPSCSAKRRRKASTSFTDGPGGMMVLPVPSMPGGKKPKKKGKNKHGQPGENVQVNLIVDPGMFGGNRREEEESLDEDSESEYTIPGTYSDRSRARRRQRGKKRRGIFAGLALEAQWRDARRMLKWNMTADVGLFFVWGAEFFYILIGKRCPSGGFDGWCDAYNVASAAACLLCIAFGVSIFFDVKDLHASKASPRTRT